MPFLNISHDQGWCRVRRFSTARIAGALLCLFLLPIFAEAQSFSVLHSFTGSGDGIGPTGLSMDQQGNLYGATLIGGPDDAGTVFKLTDKSSGWVLSPLYSFTGRDGDGKRPLGVVVGPDGKLYGTTGYGGSSACNSGCGTVFSLSPLPTFCGSVLCPWMETQLFVFHTLFEGALPTNADLVFDSSGNIYGTTSEGGTSGFCTQYGCGVAYELSKSNAGWNEKVIYSFQDGPGFEPYAGMIFDSSGNLYGTTVGGGRNGLGTIYRLTPQNGIWSESDVYDFSPSPNFGQWPQAGLTMDRSGNLYAATWAAGPSDGGVAIQLSPSGQNWNTNLVYAFQGSGDNPAGPTYTLTPDGSGNLYGTTETEGAFDYGTVFELSYHDGSWVYTSLHDFTGGSDGSYPSSKLLLDSQGNLYGAASSGGIQNSQCSSGCGVIFKISPVQR